MTSPLYWYLVLGVSPHASQQTIDAAFITRVLRTPECGPEQVQELVQALRTARKART